MAVEFRCEQCGKLLNLEAQPGATVRCPHCRKSVVVPAALASLPRPQVPPNAQAPSGGAAPPPPLQAPPAPGAGEEDVLEVEDHEPDAVMAVMAAIMPWVISAFLHAGLALIFLFLVMVVMENPIPDEVIVPDAYMTDDPGGPIDPADPNIKKRVTNLRRVKRRGFTKKESTDLGKTKKQVTLIGMGDAGSTGAMGRMGLNIGGSGPRSNFMGTGGNAYHVVYVIDRSGSMTGPFDDVRAAMLKSIGRLRQTQDFHVIMFAAGLPKEPPARRLVPATKANKVAAGKFLFSVSTQGQTDPIPALKRAFDVLNRANKARKGKLIYLLTDASFPDNDKILAMISARNASREVHINTYLYDEKSPEARKVMKKIASENRGFYKYISDDE